MALTDGELVTACSRPLTPHLLMHRKSVAARTAVATARPSPCARYRYAARGRHVWLVLDAMGEAGRVPLGGIAM